MEPSAEQASTPQGEANIQTPTSPEPIKSNKPKALIATAIACAILAVAGITFGVYEMINANQKSQQISELKVYIEGKNTKITELETTISELNAGNKDAEAVEVVESEAEENSDNTATIILGDIIDENETNTVFKIGQCTADGPSVKCPITTPNGEALISFLTTDHVLRLSLPND